MKNRHRRLMRRPQRRAAELAARSALATSGAVDPSTGFGGVSRTLPFEMADNVAGEAVASEVIGSAIGAVTPERQEVPAEEPVRFPTTDDASVTETVAYPELLPPPEEPSEEIGSAVGAVAPERQETPAEEPVRLTATDDAPPAEAVAHPELLPPPEEPSQESSQELDGLDTATRLMQAAREAVESGAHERAVGMYREVLGMDPTRVQARTQLAMALQVLGRGEEAIEQLDTCVREAAEPAPALLSRAAVLCAQGQYTEAERDLRQAVQLEPSNADGHYNLGLVKIRRGLWSDAIPHLRRAVELDQSRAPAHYYLGEALNHVDDLDAALLAYQRATELQPRHAEAFYGVGIILDRLGRPEEAATMYRRSREMARR